MRTTTFVLSLLLIFIMPWEGVIQIRGLGTGAKALGLLVGALWFASVIVSHRIRKISAFQVMVCIFVMWNAISIFWSANPGRTWRHLLTWFQLLALIFMLWDLYATRSAIRAGLQAYVFGSYFAVGSALSNYMSGHAFYTNYQRFSPGNTNPDGFGFVLALGIPIAWYLASSDSTDRLGKLLRGLNYAYIPAAFVGVALSGTRMAMIASLVGTLYGIASLTRVRPRVRIISALFIIVAVVYLLPYVQTLKSFQRLGTTESELTGGDLNNRTNNWREGLDTFVEHPFVGIGSNMYRSINSLGKVAHNSYVSVLVELGLVGFGLFGMILIMALTRAWSHKQKWDRLFWLTIFTVWSIGSFTLTWEYRKTTWLFLTLIIASAALARRQEEDSAVPAIEAGNYSPGATESPYPV